MIVWAALALALGMAALSLRTMAHAFGASVGRAVVIHARSSAVEAAGHVDCYGRRQIWMLGVEIAFSVGITLLIIGLAYAMAMPGQLLVGALLAQVAVVGSLMAPAQVHNVGGVGVRPAAIALGVAQLAHAVFFIKAVQALIG